ncbi:MAG TPA: ABC transporter ATP-binding protein [bacterium]|nr:ABC transporter ATP-binding protein [bacterium]
METLWQLNQVTKVYQLQDPFGRTVRVEALASINLTGHRGQTLGLVGESGSGKSTLGKVLLRLVPPTSGQIFFRGTDLTGLSETRLRLWRKNFQIVFQDPYRSLNPRLTAGDLLMEGIPGSYRERVVRARDLLLKVGLSREDFYRLPHQFSGGQRQRLAIARALGPGPELLVCDEPTSNLDLSIQAQILNLFLELKQDYALTYLFISHNLKVVEFLADRIAVMYRGHLVEVGPTALIMKKACHPYSRALVASARYQPTRMFARPVRAGCCYASFCPRGQSQCYQQQPPLQEIAPDHQVACFLPEGNAS